MAEAGLPDFDGRHGAGFVVPNGTPAVTRDRLHAALVAASTNPEARERLRRATFMLLDKPLGFA